MTDIIFFNKPIGKYDFLSFEYIHYFDSFLYPYYSSYQSYELYKAQYFKKWKSVSKIQNAKTIKEVEDNAIWLWNPCSYLTWLNNRDHYMYLSLAYKFKNNKLRDMLLATGNARLVAAIPGDFEWGIGYDEKEAKLIPEEKWGKNKMGKYLMQIRDQHKEFLKNFP